MRLARVGHAFSFRGHRTHARKPAEVLTLAAVGRVGTVDSANFSPARQNFRAQKNHAAQSPPHKADQSPLPSRVTFFRPSKIFRAPIREKPMTTLTRMTTKQQPPVSVRNSGGRSLVMIFILLKKRLTRMTTKQPLRTPHGNAQARRSCPPRPPLAYSLSACYNTRTDVSVHRPIGCSHSHRAINPLQCNMLLAYTLTPVRIVSAKAP
jgi:hypothetical protein